MPQLFRGHCHGSSGLRSFGRRLCRLSAVDGRSDLGRMQSSFGPPRLCAVVRRLRFRHREGASARTNASHSPCEAIQTRRRQSPVRIASSPRSLAMTKWDRIGPGFEREHGSGAPAEGISGFSISRLWSSLQRSPDERYAFALRTNSEIEALVDLRICVHDDKI